MKKFSSNGRKRWNLFFPLRAKFIIWSFLLISVPFLISGIVTYSKYASSVEANTRSYTLQIIDQITVNLDRYIKEMERLTLTPFYDSRVLSILDNHNNSYNNPVFNTSDEVLKMNLFLSSLAFDRTELRGMFIFANDGSLYSTLDSTLPNRWLPEAEQWMAAVRSAEGGLVLVPPHYSPYYDPQKPELVFAIARLIRDPNNNKKSLGFVKADLTSRGLEKILSAVSFSKNAKLFITDRTGRSLYPDLSPTKSVEVPEKEQVFLDGAEYLSAWKQSEYTGLKVIALVPVQDLRKDANELTQFTLLISLFSLIIAGVLAVLLSNRLVNPIRHLQTKMKRVQQGAFEERAIVSTHDEIGQLSQGFNVMVGEIDRLVKEVYETRLRERDAELAALQSQINPHFLYNTLESINMMALQRDYYEVSDMVVSLGKLLRYTVDRQEKLVYLREEVRFVQAYLNIQGLRYGERLTTVIEVDPMLELCLIPKLILQPLIENAIEHGIGTEAGTVRVSARRDDNQLILSVQDSGQGMSALMLATVSAQIYAPSDYSKLKTRRNFDEVKKGFALRNVHQRLQLLYGEPYGLYIDETAQQGSCFILRLPFQLEE